MRAQRMSRGEFMRDPAVALDLAMLSPVHIVGADGTVRMILSQPELDDVPNIGRRGHPCSFCRGTGFVDTNPCQECRSTGTEPQP